MTDGSEWVDECDVDERTRDEILRLRRRVTELETELETEHAEFRRSTHGTQDQREILESIVSQLGDGVVVADQTGKFLLFNPAAERIVGIGITDAPPERWSEVYGIYYPDRVTPFPWSDLPLVRALEGHETRDVEMFVRHATLPDGVFISVSGTPLMSGDTVRGAVVVFRDVSQSRNAGEARRLLELAHHQADERRRVEAELERVRDTLIRRTRFSAIGELAASIAHDLRNPLGAIRNSSFYLSRQVPPDHADWSRHLEIIEHETRAADRIIDNLLDMSRSKAPEREELDLAVVVREAFGGDHGPTGVELELRLEGGPYRVWADHSQLRRLLGNLLTNAEQAMDGTGKVVVRARRVGEMDVITITDQGKGVPDALRERIFEPLFTTRAKGTGLGLAICRQIAERHDGTLALSETGEAGSTFELKLPHAAGID
ncbi:MAG TPA: ATP-binding protein [Candidatus Polarisedimenticolaceae bacterium]|nr:ATP-binding protein [Candidatus Polarisedimenticolaceae bacterium]